PGLPGTTWASANRGRSPCASTSSASPAATSPCIAMRSASASSASSQTGRGAHLLRQLKNARGELCLGLGGLGLRFLGLAGLGVFAALLLGRGASAGLGRRRCLDRCRLAVAAALA